MDISSIAKLDKTVLMGLDFSMRPENVRYEAIRGFITPLPEQRVMHRIKSLAIMVYNQEKLIPMYHANVCDASNPLAYFICAVHRQSAPQPQKKKDRHTSVSSNSSSESKTSCKSAVSGKNCELPTLVTTSMLPLGYWDSLYYALLSEIRQLHGDLQEKFGWALQQGNEPLHHEGIDGVHKEPITAIDFAAMLETAWYELMDNRLVATLDDAVRMRKIGENAAKKPAQKQKYDSAATPYHGSAHEGCGMDTAATPSHERPPVDEGLIDINGMTTEAIVEALWKIYAPEVDRACAENFEDESMLTVHGATARAQKFGEAQTVSTPSASDQHSCRCRSKCMCDKIKCDSNSDHCTCKNYAHHYNHTIDNDEARGDLSAVGGQPEMKKSHPGPGFKNNPCYEMQSSSIPASHSNQASRSVQDHRSHTESLLTQEHRAAGRAASRHRNRQRANTNNSELAYVPEAKISQRRGKDAYPLGFYGDGSSPGRYPRLTQQTSASSSANEAVARVSPPSYEMPLRKPVPPPSAPIKATQYVKPQTTYGSITPPSSSEYHTNPYLQDTQPAWPGLLMTQPQQIITQSFPVTSSNSREAGSDPFVDQAATPSPANDYLELLSRHPSSFEPESKAIEQHQKPADSFGTRSRATTTSTDANTSPALSRTATNISPPRKKKTGSATSSRINLSKLRISDDAVNNPLPPLPQPSFIAPRPAKVQRYVSAGGDAKLADRPEIAGPAFSPSGGISTPQEGSGAAASGASMSKAELDAKMSDPEWVRTHFGAAAMPVMERKSLERKSEDVGEMERVRTASVSDMRDRTSSGAARRGLLKRVFSRKTEGEDWD